MIQIIVKSCSNTLVLPTSYEAVFFVSTIEETNSLASLKHVHKGQPSIVLAFFFTFPQAED
jgi:hypothetical protein